MRIEKRCILFLVRWGTCYLHFKDVDTNKAIYNCQIYQYGETFEKTISTLENAFSQRKIKLPIYVDENGTHTTAFKSISADSSSANNYAKPIAVMEERKSGLCLWDDTQSMSYLNISTFNWYNQKLMDKFTAVANQKKR